MASLDLDYIRNQFPAFQSEFSRAMFFENAADLHVPASD